MKMFAIAALALALTAGPALAQTPGTAKPALTRQTPAPPATQKPAAPREPAAGRRRRAAAAEAVPRGREDRLHRPPVHRLELG